jgi:LuxR family transcriptional regulator, regulator of acetate metabolism
VSASAQVDAGSLRRVLAEMLALEREIVEADYVRRSDALERVSDAIRRLGEIGSPQGILDRAAEELGASSEFDRVLIGEVRSGSLFGRAMWSGDRPDQAATALEELRRGPVALEYPSVEDEIARRQGVRIVSARDPRGRAAARLTALLDWDSYVVTAIAVQGNVVGLLFGGARASGRTVDSLDAEVAARYAEGLAGVFERAVLRAMLQQHHHELRSGLEWMSARLAQLAAGAGDSSGLAPGAAGQNPGAAGALTPRELEVLRLLARGQTNLEIARALVVREGTVKYHVKNILRKLGATSRADAVARYSQATRAAATR